MPRLRRKSHASSAALGGGACPQLPGISSTASFRHGHVQGPGSRACRSARRAPVPLKAHRTVGPAHAPAPQARWSVNRAQELAHSNHRGVRHQQGARVDDGPGHRSRWRPTVYVGALWHSIGRRRWPCLAGGCGTLVNPPCGAAALFSRPRLRPCPTARGSDHRSSLSQLHRRAALSHRFAQTPLRHA